MEKIIDLHIHTNISDGALTPKEIIDEAKKNNVHTIAIADHDTIDAYTKKLFNYAKNNNINIIPAVEISTKINNVSLESLECTWHEDYIGITDFEVYDENGEKLTSTNLEIKRTLTYEDGRVEQWGRGDIGTCDSFYNGTMELEEIIIIEKKAGINLLKIVPTVQEIIWKDGRNERMEQEVKLTEFNLELNSREE